MGRRTLFLGVCWLLMVPRVGSATTVGNIFSGPTARNAASVFWNPAAMTLLRGSEVMLFGSAAPIWAQYQRDTVSSYDGLPFPEATIFMMVPGGMVAAVTDLGLRDFRFGVGVSAPHVEGARWARSYEGRPASTRYFVEDSYAITIVSQLAAAYRINRYLSIGVGLDVNTTLTRYEAQLDFAAKVNFASCASNTNACQVDAPLSRENPDFDAFVYNQGHGWTVGMVAGLLFTPTPWLRIGAGFHTGGKASYPVTLFLELPPAAVDYLQAELPSIDLSRLVAEVEAVLHVPMMATFSVAVDISPRMGVAFDLEWHDASQTAVIFANVLHDYSGGFIHDIVLVKGLRDFWQATLHGHYDLNPRWRLGWRIEFKPSTRPEEFTTPISVDFTRFVFYVGAEWRIRDYLALSAEFGQYMIFGNTVRLSKTRFGPNPTPTTPEEESLDKPPPTGDYSAQAFKVGLSARLFF